MIAAVAQKGEGSCPAKGLILTGHDRTLLIEAVKYGNKTRKNFDAEQGIFAVKGFCFFTEKNLSVL